jgi:hypothetical protein
MLANESRFTGITSAPAGGLSADRLGRSWERLLIAMRRRGLRVPIAAESRSHRDWPARGSDFQSRCATVPRVKSTASELPPRQTKSKT